MNKQDILDHESKTLEMKKTLNKRIEILKGLNPGDTVHIGGAQGFDIEYFPQIIVDINLEMGTLMVYEKSIDKFTTIESFYILQNDKFTLIL